jgi:diacylglycerol kinase family enzyme
VRDDAIAARVAAWIALAAGVAALVALVLLVFRNFLTLLVVLLAFAIAGAAAWIVLSRTGLTRYFGAAVVILALVGAGAALITRDAIDELVALVLAFIIFGVASRWAIRSEALAGRSLTDTKADTNTGGHSPHRAVLIMNPKSGGGKVDKFYLVAEAKRRGIKPVLLQPGDDLRVLAADATRTADVIGMAGGDGSQALVAQIAMERGLEYVCVPAGTRNHLALDLGLDRDDVVGALEAFSSPIGRKVDLGFVNGRVFVNNVSLGVYAEIVQSDAYRDAKLQTMEEMLPQMLGPRAEPFDLRYRGPNDEEHSSAQMILVSNNPYHLTSLAGMGSRPTMDTGRLGVVTVEIRNAREMAELISLEGLRQVSRFPGWREWTADQFEVQSSRKVAAGIDGEAILLDPPLQFSIAPAALTVRLPPQPPGLSPAAIATELNRESAVRLWKIATGTVGSTKDV